MTHFVAAFWKMIGGTWDSNVMSVARWLKQKYNDAEGTLHFENIVMNIHMTCIIERKFRVRFLHCISDPNHMKTRQPPYSRNLHGNYKQKTNYRIECQHIRIQKCRLLVNRKQTQQSPTCITKQSAKDKIMTRNHNDIDASSDVKWEIYLRILLRQTEARAKWKLIDPEIRFSFSTYSVELISITS